MRILKVGDTTRAACEQCQSFQAVTFELRDAPLSDGSGTVKNVLLGVCDQCHSIAVLPHQSTPAVKRQLEIQRKSVESRVPAHMIDILNLASDELGGGSEFVPNLVKFYIYSLSNEKISARKLPRYLESDLAKGAAQKRISIKGRNLHEEIKRLKEMTDIKSTSSLIKGIVLKINDDILVHKQPETIHQLQTIVAVTHG